MLSIIIPAYNEASFIDCTLQELQDLIKDRSDIEVIVIDNASTDGTGNIVRRRSWVKLITLPERVTVAAARNAGVGASIGSCFAFIDADILVSSEWFSALIDFAHICDEEPLSITGCKVAISRKPSWIEQSWFRWMKTYGANYINSGNLICSRKVFNRVNGFCESLKTGEDVDFCHRAKNLGIAVRPDPSFLVYHEGYPKTILDFFARERWHGIGDTQSIKKFFASKVAIASLIMMMLTFLSVILFLGGEYSAAFGVIALISLFNVMALLKRLRVVSLRQFLTVFFLNYLYFFARFLSLFSHSFTKKRS
ncbi:glycosyltransferase [Cellvibrio sp. OA-2007]|uniref:glycosyltransferase n=1 Tax=Cellvibrio sp. OA-2007 TaxID=529823 RepID=UPI000780DED4|nr:glycosyltransferase [Cellvibrio sp. OA-2007]